MLTLPPSARVFVCTCPTDMRKSFDGLAGLLAQIIVNKFTDHLPLARISFVDAVRWLRQAQADEPMPVLIVHPERPGRFEPRVVKRRPNPHKLMTQPRRELKEAMRNKP